MACSYMHDPLGYEKVDDQPAGVHHRRHQRRARHRRVVPAYASSLEPSPLEVT